MLFYTQFRQSNWFYLIFDVLYILVYTHIHSDSTHPPVFFFAQILFHQMSPLNVDSHTFHVCLRFLWWKTYSYQDFRQMLQVLFSLWTMNCLYFKRMGAAPGGSRREYYTWIHSTLFIEVFHFQCKCNRYCDLCSFVM